MRVWISRSILISSIAEDCAGGLGIASAAHGVPRTFYCDTVKNVTARLDQQAATTPRPKE
jgi:hypothetical protein